MSGKNTTANPQTPNEQASNNPDGQWILRGVDYPVFIESTHLTQGQQLTPEILAHAKTWDDFNDEEKSFFREQGFYYGNWEKGEKPIRKLTKEEREIWGEAVFQATLILPAFRPSVSIMSPGRDRGAGTVYTTEDAKVGLGDLFFYQWDKKKRASAVLHECMHVLYNHFKRFKRLSDQPDQLMNIAGDFEINGALSLVRKCDISMGVHPEQKINVAPDHPWAPMNGKPMWGEGFKIGKSMEDYYALLESEVNKNQNSNGDGSGSGSGAPGSGHCPVHGDSDADGHSHENAEGNNCSCQGWSCSAPSDQTKEELAEAGVEGSSFTEMENARANTKSNIIEEQKTSRSYSNGASNDFLSLVMDRLKEPKVPWQSIFRQVFSYSVNNIVAGRTDYNYRRSNRRMSGSKYIFPGMVSYTPEVAFGIDTSGSMSKNDYMSLLKEAEVIIKSATRGGNGLSVFCVDTQIENIQKVRSINDIDLRGGGGTDMSVAFNYINEQKPKERPDLFVLATDGYIPWEQVIDELKRKEARSYKSIILITSRHAFEQVPDKVKRLATIIDVSIEDDTDEARW